MALQFTPRERRQARSYRSMVRKVRQRQPPAARSKAFGGGAAGFARRSTRAHLAAVAQLFCVATAVRFGLEKTGVHVAHIRFSSAAFAKVNPGLQRKPHDRWVLPLSPHEHRRQHAGSEQAYWAELNIDPHWLAEALWDASPNVQAMQDRLRAAVGECAMQRSPN